MAQLPTVRPSPPPAGDVAGAFTAGYLAAGGNGNLLPRVLRTMMCESEGKPRAYNAAGPYYGLMQFSETTWQSVGGGDWFDPYTQGANTARLMARANPATQWPVCWNA